jgi:hypothetical protein
VKVHYDVVQRSDEWRRLRAGKLTGSRAKDMLAAVKSGEAAKRRDLRYQLITERLTGTPQESGYVNAAMEWGTAHEAEAVAAYEAETGQLVQAVGFCEHGELLAGTSPDGFVGDDGILSIKCPMTATHVSYLRQGGEPSEHAAQNTHELWLTQRAFIDFFSYDPRLPVGLRCFLVRVTRSGEDRQKYDAEARKFLAEVDTEYQALATMADLAGTLKAAV